MESSPLYDSLAYLSFADVIQYLDELDNLRWKIDEVAFTGGEPFMNKDLLAMMEAALVRHYKVLVLSNGMQPMWNNRKKLIALSRKFSGKLVIRVSMDHYTKEKHESERGPLTWGPMLKGLKWLSNMKVGTAVAGRTLWDETEESSRNGYEKLFYSEEINVSARDKNSLVLFPEMDIEQDVPEISSTCWKQLGVDPKDIMCSSSRMVIKRKGEPVPVVVPCTLLPYDQEFVLGNSLSKSSMSVQLNHPHCAKFCVLGGGSCSGL